MLTRIGVSLWFALLLSCLASTAVFGQPPALVLTGAVDLPVTGEHIELLRDPAGDLGFVEVSSAGLDGRFEPAGSGVPNIGFTRDTIWVRFRIRNTTGSMQKRLLVFGEPRAASVDFWARTSPRGEPEHIQNGRFLDPAKRDLSYRHFLFDLQLEQGSTTEVYLRIRSYDSVNLQLALVTPERIAADSRWEYLLLGGFYGALLVMFGYNLILFGFLRDRSYLFLCLIILCALLWRADFDGLLTTVVPGLWPYRWPGMLLGASCGLAAISLFTCTFLGTRRHAPRHHWLLSFLAGVGVALPLLFTIDPTLAMVALSIYALAVSLTAISAGFLSWYLGHHSALHFLLAWLMCLSAVVVLTLMNFELVPIGPLQQAGPYIGSLMTVLLLSVAQADRINVLRADLEQANLALRRNEARLGELVNERTVELTYARDHAEAASKAKSQFLAHVSHELRTPMNSVLGFASLLRQQEQPPLSQSYLDAIEGAGRTLLILIGDILDLSKVESGKLELQNGAVEVRVFAAELRRMFSEQAVEKGLQLTVLVDQGVPDWIVTDEVRVRQILFNFIGNAVKYTERGRIDLNISAQPVDDGHFQLLFAVADTGPGIPSVAQEFVFDPFVQLDVQSEFGGGVGLGLTICARLAGLMGGEIRLRSEPDVGSTFTLLLQAVTLAAPPSWPSRDVISPLPQIEFQPARVLITDDDPSNRLLLREYLRPCGFDLIEAESGEQALKLVRSDDPDLILMDIGLPDMDGIAVTRELKADPHTAAIPVIAVTAAVIGNRAEEAVYVCDGYLTKPVSKAALLDALGVFIERRISSSAEPREDVVSNGTRVSPLDIEEMHVSPALHKRIATFELPYCAVDEIEALAGEILDEGQEAGDPRMVELAEQLMDAAGQFDAEGAARLLQDAGPYRSSGYRRR